MRLGVWVVVAGAVGCIPYTVGTTAQPVPVAGSPKSAAESRDSALPLKAARDGPFTGRAEPRVYPRHPHGRSQNPVRDELRRPGGSAACASDRKPWASARKSASTTTARRSACGQGMSS